jgi:hypothetical protein
MTSPQREPVDRLLDVALYAPLGLASIAREHWSEWADRGREQLAAHVPAARLVGQMVLDQGAKRARKRVDDLPERAVEVVAELGAVLLRALAGESDADSDGDDAGERVSAASPRSTTAAGGGGGGGGAGHGGQADVASISSRKPAAARRPGSGNAADLAIPGYDTLSASQVVQRLPGLSASELDAIRAYEESRRARKMVLLKVAQLRSAG